MRSVDVAHSTLVINAASVTLPNGKTTALDGARTKTVVVGAATMLTDTHGVRLEPAALVIGSAAAAVGMDSGAGSALDARVVVIAQDATAAKPRTPDTRAVEAPDIAGKCLTGYRALTWDIKKQGGFVMSLCMDLRSRLYFGMEDTGIWRYDPIAAEADRWTHFTTKDGLADNTATAIGCSCMGLIWAGGNRGVSVYNGKSWKSYDVLAGPLGSRIFAIAICPTDKDVWMASDAGLARYSFRKNTWSYFTRAVGLPIDQANDLAFDAYGNIFVASQCEGIAMAKAKENYAKWTVESGPARMPRTPIGNQMPSNLPNCLLVGRKTGAVYAGTTTGLAKSSDDGKSWSYVRGADWREKVLGLYHGPQPASVPNCPPLLLEDYVTALAEDGEGRLWVGHRQKGVEVLDPATGKVVAAFQGDYITRILTLPGGGGVVAHYGAGVKRVELPAAADDAAVGIPEAAKG